LKQLSSMKFTGAALFAVFSAAEAVKIERRDARHDRELRAKGKGSAAFDEVCLATCEETCAISDCIPLDATSAPTKGKGGKRGSGKGSSSEAPSFFCSEAPSIAPSVTASAAPSATPCDPVTYSWAGVLARASTTDSAVFTINNGVAAGCFYRLRASGVPANDAASGQYCFSDATVCLDDGSLLTFYALANFTPNPNVVGGTPGTTRLLLTFDQNSADFRFLLGSDVNTANVNAQCAAGASTPGAVNPGAFTQLSP